MRSAGWDQSDQLCVNTVRTLSMDAVQQANSGHPGLPMGAASMAYVLWTRFLRHNPLNPHWADRDRFVLSAGHGSMLLYSLLHLSGYGLPLEELRRFRQWGSMTPGHPEVQLAPGVETTTGPLGQGLTNGVGMAIAERHLAARFNRPGHTIIDHRVFGVLSDGDFMEGVSHEAASLAGHLQLGNIIYLYDDNGVSIDGSTDLTFTEDVAARFAAYGWHVQQVDNGNDLAVIESALVAACRETSRPSLILVPTVIAYGSPNKAGSYKAHGAPLGLEEVHATKLKLGWPWPDETFVVPDEVRERMRSLQERGALLEAEWTSRLARYAEAYPDDAAELQRRLAGQLAPGWDADLPQFDPSQTPRLATRQASGKTLEVLASRLPELIGGSADLAESNLTLLPDTSAFQADAGLGRNIFFGVREHAMGGILSGIALHGGLRPFGGTFLIFSDYMRPALRLAALMELPVTYVFTHDSIGLGEDGPTHQPVEHLMSLRAMPNFWVIRPADAAETVEAWRVALRRRSGPTALILTRQPLPVLGRDGKTLAYADGLACGGYILADSERGHPDVILIGTGSELHLCLAAKDLLVQEHGLNARVVSLPCWELFQQQAAAYRDQVLPPEVRARVSVEAGASLGWREFVGEAGVVLGLDRFGASAPHDVLYRELGLTPEAVVRCALQSIADASAVLSPESRAQSQELGAPLRTRT